MKPIDCEEHYDEPLHYDARWAGKTDDVKFFLFMARQVGGPILELGCGTGRITIPLAEGDYKLFGLDMSQPMLDAAGKKARQRMVDITWVQGDMRDFDLKKKFRQVILPFNTIGHLHERETLDSFFRCVKNHMKSEGRFTLDYFNPSLEILTRVPEERFHVADWTDPEDGKKVTLYESSWYDAPVQVNRVTLYYSKEGEPEEIEKELDVRIFFPEELDALLHFSGFDIEYKYGDYDMSEFTAGSPKQLMVCKMR